MKYPLQWIATSIFCLLAVVAVFTIYVQRAEERDAINQAEADAKQISMFLRDYAHAHGGVLPDSFSALVTTDGKYLNSEEYLAYEATHFCTLKFPGAAWDGLSDDAVLFDLAMPNRRKIIHVYSDIRTTVSNQ